MKQIKNGTHNNTYNQIETISQTTYEKSDLNRFDIIEGERVGGRCRNKIRMYTHIKRAGVAGEFPIEEMINIADQRLAEGYTALKYSIIPPIRQVDTPANTKAHVERFAKIREHIGWDIDLAIDFHGRVSPAAN